MILDLLLDPDNSLLFEYTALEEVEKFLLKARKTLSKEELDKLKGFIQTAPDPDSTDTEDEVGIPYKRKKHFLELIENNAKPIGQEYFRIRSGRVEPLMSEEEFSALADDQIAELLTQSSRGQLYNEAFRDVSLDWERFVPRYPDRSWDILQKEECVSSDKLWEKTFWALAHTLNQPPDKEVYDKQWEIFSAKNGFIDKYLEKQLNPHPIVDWLNRIVSKIGLDDKTYLVYWFSLWECVNTLPVFTSTIQLGGETFQQDYLSTAINDPRGKLAEGILDALYRHKPGIGTLIPDFLLKAVNTIFETVTEQGWLAQLIFARHLRNLVIIDQDWTKSVLLPAFDYNENLQRAARMWVGFLNNPNLNFESFEIIKPLLLGLISFWNQVLPNDMYHLSDLRRNLVHLIVFYKISFPDSLTDNEFEVFFRELDVNDLSGLFALIEDLLTDPIEKGQELSFWEMTLKPFLSKFWPAQKNSPSISLSFLEMAARCPNAMISISEYLKTKPFLTKADFNHNRFIYSISHTEDSSFHGILLSIENAKAFFDLFWMIAKDLTENEIHHWTFYGIKEFFDICINEYPVLLEFGTFQKVRHKFQVLL